MFNTNTKLVPMRLIFLLPTCRCNGLHIGFYSGSFQNKDYKIGIGCFSAKHTALRSK